MLETVQKYLAKQLRIDPSEVTPEKKIQEDLGADSLDILQFLMTMEMDYGIVVPDEKLANFVTVADVVAYMDEKKNA